MRRYSLVWMRRQGARQRIIRVGKQINHRIFEKTWAHFSLVVAREQRAKCVKPGSWSIFCEWVSQKIPGLNIQGVVTSGLIAKRSRIS